MMLLLPWLLLLSAVRAAATCYSYEGKELDMYPCDATAKISPCCGNNDYCLSNGLCLNAGGNNAYTQQGCTDKGWGFPCQKYCPGNTGKNGDDGDYRYLTQCSGLGGSMCCGLDYDCCNGTAILTSIPIFTTLSPPAGIPSTSTTSSSTVSTSATSSAVTSAATGGSEPQPHSAKPAADRSVAIGAGVGVPLGVALVAAISLLVWQMRRRAAAEKDLKTATTHAYTHVEQKPTPTELYTPQPVSELPTNEANHP